MDNNQTTNPCIGYCSTSLGDEWCKGCGRYWGDVVRWNTYDEEWRKFKMGHILDQKQKQKFLIMCSTEAHLSDDDVKVGAMIKSGEACVFGHNTVPNNHLHAEMRALLAAAKQGISTNHTTLFCTHTPCPECAVELIEAGVAEVILSEKVHWEMQRREKWEKNWEITRSLFKKYKVKWEFV